jgi:hypothetical protein
LVTKVITAFWLVLLQKEVALERLQALVAEMGVLAVVVLLELLAAPRLQDRETTGAHLLVQRLVVAGAAVLV